MMETLEDAYAEGRKDEREAIVAYLVSLHRKSLMHECYASYYARLIEQMDIQPRDTDAKP
jgi:hypothetical protein